MTADLAAFLAGRLDEQQATAQAVLDAAGLFPREPSRQTPLGHRAFDGSGIITMHDHTVVLPSDVARHIAANDPARTLRAITAKRAILALHETRTKGEGHDGRPRCRTCTAIADGHARRFAAPCPTLCHLGTEWDDHPDYLPEWAPLQ